MNIHANLSIIPPTNLLVGLLMNVSMDFPTSSPRLVLFPADTVKSRGLSFAEGKVEFHYWKAKPEELAQAERDLDTIERSLA